MTTQNGNEHLVQSQAEPEQPLSCLELEKKLWVLYRDFFDKAEKKRRWNIRHDIPWNQVNKSLSPVIADVVETFCAVELYLPDFTSKILPIVRNSKGRVWFYANWGYEESKHSLVLNDWLLQSGARTEEYMADLEKKVFEREWNLPHDNNLGMLCYAMVQEHATFLNYRNLRNRTQEMGKDPALEAILNYLSIDEKAHYGFFRDCFRLFMEFDRPACLQQLKRVLNGFTMPAIHDLLDNSAVRIGRIRELDLFSEEIFFRDVYEYTLTELELTRQDLRGDRKAKKSTPGIAP
ncbi:acyl-ACP desaturase [Telmatocola sphagniphila]|uniref:Acyl-ACP desaturase n=1 Tax=Telmatocola sphagniphila TaxID=1123043 RepID=A0A8E6B189_9BACT|nr:acyl-ACP desaturase [Telmatocola sphagniphila]QVL29862.1 acyl-ACP desaturase [Telmatocola sphagniphila]